MGASVRIVVVALAAVLMQACATGKQTLPTPGNEAAGEVPQPESSVATGGVQPCSESDSFATLSSVLEKPVAGRVAVRGKVWMPVVVRCTAAIPERCLGEMILAEAKATEPADGQITLTGRMPNATPLVCAGRRHELRCPLSADGGEYGVTGQLTIEGDATESWLSLEVEGICRF